MQHSGGTSQKEFSSKICSKTQKCPKWEVLCILGYFLLRFQLERLNQSRKLSTQWSTLFFPHCRIVCSSKARLVWYLYFYKGHLTSLWQSERPPAYPNQCNIPMRMNWPLKSTLCQISAQTDTLTMYNSGPRQVAPSRPRSDRSGQIFGHRPWLGHTLQSLPRCNEPKTFVPTSTLDLVLLWIARYFIQCVWWLKVKGSLYIMVNNGTK
jgi:hypothetical protein